MWLKRLEIASVRKMRDRRGAISIEASIVVMTVLFIMMIAVSFGFFIYEQHNLRVTADNTAQRVAQTFAHPDADIETGAYASEEGVNPYRYVSGYTAELKTKNTSRAKTHGVARLQKLSLADGDEECNVRFVDDGFGRCHIEVEMSAQYRVIGGSFFKLLDLPEPTFTYHATGRAECQDLMRYLSDMNYIGSLAALDFTASSAVSAINALMGLIGG